MSKTATTQSPPLNQPLPPDLVAGMTWGPFAYRRYAVFSLPWLKGRLLGAAIAIVSYGALVTLGQRGAGESWASALLATWYFVIGFLLMVSVGPALGTWIRYRGLSSESEARAVIAAVIFGCIAGMAADAWSSGRIKQVLNMKEVPVAERKISKIDEAGLSLFKTASGLLYFACGGGLAAMAYFSERRRLSARAAHVAQLESSMRLAVLQAQVEPHFLFNTLASIRPLIRQNAERAEAAFDALTEHLRATIPQIRAQSGEMTSTLGQQVAICESYLKVMKVRMGERLQIEITVPEGMRSLEFPPLMLLSLVENAIKHGIEPKPGLRRIGIRAEMDGAWLKVGVADDGAGLKDGLNTGLGLSNIRDQLAMRFAGEARLNVAARPDGGTVAEIVVPLTPSHP